MVHALSLWLLVAGFFGAGLFNAIGTSATQSNFARWGYPRWWSFLTGGLEIMSAVLIALPASRIIGLALGAAIISAAVLTVLRHRRNLPDGQIKQKLSSLRVKISPLVPSGKSVVPLRASRA